MPLNGELAKTSCCPQCVDVLSEIVIPQKFRMMTFLLATTFLVLGNLAHFTNGHNTYYDCSRVALDIGYLLLCVFLSFRDEAFILGLTVMGQVTTFSADRYFCRHCTDVSK